MQLDHNAEGVMQTLLLTTLFNIMCNMTSLPHIFQQCHKFVDTFYLLHHIFRIMIRQTYRSVKTNKQF